MDRVWVSVGLWLGLVLGSWLVLGLGLQLL
jgi:hypothetical protein